MMHLSIAGLFAFILLSTLQTVILQDPECPEDGYFPSMTSCRQYNICLNGLKRTYICKNGIFSVYSPITRSCVKQRLGSKCYKFLCIGPKLHYIAYRGDPSIYVLCYKYTPQLLQKCPSGKEFNNKAQKCLITCGGSEGNKFDPQDCTAFYECVKAPGINKYNINRRMCPKNSWFNPDLSQCTETGIENCPKVAPTTTTQPPTTSTTERQPTPIFTTRSYSSTPSPIASTTSTVTPFTTHTKPTTPTTTVTSITPIMSTTPPLTTYTNPITPKTTVTAPITSTTPVLPTTAPFTIPTDSTSTITVTAPITSTTPVLPTTPPFTIPTYSTSTITVTAPITSTTPAFTPTPPFITTTHTNPTTPTATVTPATVITSTTEKPDILTTTGLPTFPWGH